MQYTRYNSPHVPVCATLFHTVSCKLVFYANNALFLFTFCIHVLFISDSYKNAKRNTLFNLRTQRNVKRLRTGSVFDSFTSAASQV